MSDLRISYAPFDDGDDFGSQQVQTASVRIRGVTDPREQELLLGRHKQDVTQFFRFADAQHRLADRQHTHLRMRRGDVEYQYVNNTGQPVIYVSLNVPAGSAVLTLDGDVVREEQVVEQIWQFAFITRFVGEPEDYGNVSSLEVTSLRSGDTLSIAPPSANSVQHILIYFSDSASADPPLDRAEEAGFPEPTDVVRMSAESGRVFTGFAGDYTQSDGVDVVYPTPIAVARMSLAFAASSSPVETTFGDTSTQSGRVAFTASMVMGVGRGWRTRAEVNVDNTYSSNQTTDFIDAASVDNHSVSLTLRGESQARWAPQGGVVISKEGFMAPVYAEQEDAVSRFEILDEFAFPEDDVTQFVEDSYGTDPSGAMSPRAEITLVSLPLYDPSDDTTTFTTDAGYLLYKPLDVEQGRAALAKFHS